MNKIRLIESLKNIMGFHIGIYTNDGEHIEGLLTEIRDDFLIIKDERGKTFFFNIDKIQAFSKNTRNFKADDSHCKPFYENSLIEVIENYQYCWVTVYCQHKFTFSGILTVISDDHIILTVKDEKLYIQKDHIITFQPEKVKPSRKPSKDKKKEENKKKEDNKENKKSDGKEQKKEFKRDSTTKKQERDKEDRKANYKKEQKRQETEKNKDHGKDNNKKKKEALSTAFKKVVKDNLNSLETPLINQISNRLKALEPAAEEDNPPKEKKQTKNNSPSTNHSDKKNREHNRKDKAKEKEKRQQSSNKKSKGGPTIKSYYGVSFREKNRKKNYYY